MASRDSRTRTQSLGKVTNVVKIIGINPDWTIGSSLTQTDTLRPPKSFPIEWGYLRQSAEMIRGLEFDFVDLYSNTIPLQMNHSKIADADYIIISTAPSYLFWRCPPLDLSAVCSAVREVRSVSTAKIVLFGPHGTVLPLPTLISTAADHVFRGEPDTELLEQIVKLHKGETTAYLASPRYPEAIVCKEVKVLGKASYAKHELQNAEPHTWIHDSIAPQASALIETSRGCSFDCPFCLRTGFRRTLREKNLDVLAAELDQLSSFGVTYVYLIDENYGLPIKHATEVAKLIFDRGMKFGIQTRPDIWSSSRIQELAERGCIYVELGIEAEDLESMKNLGKFARPMLAWEMMEVFKNLIPFVGLNCFDTTNPDLKIASSSSIALDKYGDATGPFIPYPTTPWGDRALGEYKGFVLTWEHVSAMHTLYSLLSRKGHLTKALRGSHLLRRIALNGITVSNRFRKRMGKRTLLTRHELLSRKRQS